MNLNLALSPKFQESFSKLLNAEVPMKTAFKLKKISNIMNDAIKNYDEVRISSLKKCVELDENGEFIIDENNNIRFLSQEKALEFQKELEQLLLTEIIIEKLDQSDLGDKITMSTADLMLLESLLV